MRAGVISWLGMVLWFSHYSLQFGGVWLIIFPLDYHISVIFLSLSAIFTLVHIGNYD